MWLVRSFSWLVSNAPSACVDVPRFICWGWARTGVWACSGGHNLTLTLEGNDSAAPCEKGWRYYCKVVCGISRPYSWLASRLSPVVGICDSASLCEKRRSQTARLTWFIRKRKVLSGRGLGVRECANLSDNCKSCVREYARCSKYFGVF